MALQAFVFHVVLVNIAALVCAGRVHCVRSALTASFSPQGAAVSGKAMSIVIVSK
jgi:hypothetical protein